jgi:hypothetical protein
VQALELETGLLCRRPVGESGEAEDARDRQRVVRGELRIQPRAEGQQPPRGRQIVQIRHRLAGEDGIVRRPLHLGELHLGIPIGALDEAHHQPPAVMLGQRGDVIDHREAALRIGLDRQPEPVPAGKRRIGQHRGEDVEGELEPLRLLGIESEVEVVGAGVTGEVAHHRHQLGHHPCLLQRGVARMQGGQLDRDARPGR